MGTNTFVNLPTVNLGYAATILAASPAALSAVSTLGPLTEGGYANGQTAWCASTGQIFVLQSAVGTPDGNLLLATADDTTRQWAYITVADGGANIRLTATSPELDLTQVQTLVVVPPIRYHAVVTLVSRMYITQKDGTVSVSPNTQVGSNSTINDVNAPATTSGLVTQAVNTVTALSGSVVPINVIDLSLFGVRFEISVGATLGSATVFKGRFNFELTIF